MKLVAVKSLPNRTGRGKLQELIDEFADSDAKVAEFTYSKTEYKNKKSADGSIRIAVQRSQHKNIKVKTVNWHTYLIKK